MNAATTDSAPPRLPLAATPQKHSIAWGRAPRAEEEEGDGVLLIEELDAPPPPDRPSKKSWARRGDAVPPPPTDPARAQRRAARLIDERLDVRPDARSRPAHASRQASTAAHAALERCLLGVDGGATPPTAAAATPPPADADAAPDCSKQCKPGHVIDLLELRRLSSRGVPDEPPAARRARAAAHGAGHGAAPAAPASPSLQRPGRSHRPLVWRVLLGYLPPQTARWNAVLDRDRRLYATLVEELFDATCPEPHRVYGEEELRTRRRRTGRTGEGLGNEVRRGPAPAGTGEFAIDDEEGEEEGEEGDHGGHGEAPRTPGHAAPPPPSSPEALTPGLLSARMQHEWDRGEDGRGSIFHGDEGGGRAGGGGADPTRRSPMCTMNTPRTGARGARGGRKALAAAAEAGDAEAPEIVSSFSISLEEEEPARRVQASLLLPHDDDDDDDDVDTGGIDAREAAPGARGEGAATAPRPVSITNATTDPHCEGVELSCPRGPPPPPPAAPPNSEEAGDLHLLDEVRKDVIRTHPDLRFFLEPNEDLGQKRYAALERILFVWAKLNKGVRYVQGMNEIVGTLYFVLAQDSDADWSRAAEPDTYFLFNALMVEMRDVFVPDLDEADTGIHGRISNMITLLSLHDPEVRCHLDGVGIDPSFYSVRWLTTLLSREFLLPDTIRLWDSMFASTHKDNFLRYVSVTMVMLIRDQLLSGDFSACLRLLQAYPPTNLDRLLEASRALWIYESQITLACHKGGIGLGHALRSIAPHPAIAMAYGLEGGLAPPMREQVRAAGERGLRAARGAVTHGLGASGGMASAGRSFFGSALSYWRAGGGTGGGGGEEGGGQTKTSSVKR